MALEPGRMVSLALENCKFQFLLNKSVSSHLFKAGNVREADSFALITLK